MPLRRPREAQGIRRNGRRLFPASTANPHQRIPYGPPRASKLVAVGDSQASSVFARPVASACQRRCKSAKCLRSLRALMGFLDPSLTAASFARGPGKPAFRRGPSSPQNTRSAVRLALCLVARQCALLSTPSRAAASATVPLGCPETGEDFPRMARRQRGGRESAARAGRALHFINAWPVFVGDGSIS